MGVEFMRAATGDTLFHWDDDDVPKRTPAPKTKPAVPTSHVAEEGKRRILVTGSREWHDRARLYCALDEVAEHQEVVLVSGGARGADQLAEEWARARGHQVEIHLADWERHGKPAGYIRNKVMADLGADIVVAFRVGMSKGTTMMMNLVKARQIPMRLEQQD